MGVSNSRLKTVFALSTTTIPRRAQRIRDELADLAIKPRFEAPVATENSPAVDRPHHSRNLILRLERSGVSFQLAKSGVSFQLAIRPSFQLAIGKQDAYPTSRAFSS